MIFSYLLDLYVRLHCVRTSHPSASKQLAVDFPGHSCAKAKDDGKTAKDDVGTAKDDVGTAEDDVGTAEDDVGTAEDDVGTAEDDVETTDFPCYSPRVFDKIKESTSC